VHAENVTGDESLGIVINNWPWVKLFVDGQWDMNAPDTTGTSESHSLIIWDEYTEYISYNPVELIPPGNHTVDVRRYVSAYNYAPFLEPIEVYVPSAFEMLEFEPEIIYASPNFVQARLSMTNVYAYPCAINYPDNQWIQLYFDSVHVTPAYQSNPPSAIINPGATYIVNVIYNPDADIPYGYHVLDFYVSDFGFLPTLPINLEDPSSTQDEVASVAELSVYPNPFYDVLNLEFTSNENTGSFIDIYNVKGQKVKVIQLMPNQHLHTLYWDGKDSSGRILPVGIYWIQAHGISLRKIVKIK
jgi:hypothetical protein